jgi:DoxX-like family
MDRPRPFGVRLRRRRCDEAVCHEKYKAQSEKNGPTGITRGLATFIGVAEVAGGLGIVLPMATNIAPSLSLWAAVGLSTPQLSVTHWFQL